jgi:putative ABC transport system permease protein
MINERGVALRYLGAQKKRSILMIFGVVLAIALISALFSILNVVQEYEVTLESASGIWHVQAADCTQQQADALSHRLDVSASGYVVKVPAASFGDKISFSLRGCDEAGAKQLNMNLIDGEIPNRDNEIAMEQWAAESLKKGARVGDTVTLKLADKTEKTFVLSGIFKSNSQNKSGNYYLAAISLDEGKQLLNTDKVSVFMQVKDGIDIDKFVQNIAKDQNIDQKSISKHTGLLTALGRSDSSYAKSIYLVGGFLALLVIFSSIMMIYNSFNISVTQRVRQFGLLRAMGATPKQIRKIVRSEAVFVSLFGVLPGLLLGVIVTTCLILFLRYTVPEVFPPEGPIFYLSWISLLIGAVTGVLSTIVSALAPARKAGKVSPVEAMAVTSGKAIKKKSASGITTKIIPVEAALALRRVTSRKRSLILTALSLSFGILLILSFNPVTSMLHEGSSQNYDLGDMYVMSSGLNDYVPDSIMASLPKVSGIKDVFPKRIAAVDATFDYSLLGSDYKEAVDSGYWQRVSKNSDGKVKAPSKSTMIGITDNDLLTLKSKLVFGDIDPQQLDHENGVIMTLTPQSLVNNGDLRPGDYIYIGSEKLKICAVIKKDGLMFVGSENPFVGFYTTNKVFEKYSSSKPNLVTMTLKNGSDSDLVFNQVKNLTSGIKNIQAVNQHESKDMADKLNLVGNVFIYGFIAVIALIGILNIINTMSTNVLVRTREIGLLRAGGMTMGQVTTMISGEAVVYGILALIIGLAAGIPLEHYFYDMMVKQIYSIPWSLPWNLIIVSSVITFVAVMISIISPLRHIKRIMITQAVTVD